MEKGFRDTYIYIYIEDSGLAGNKAIYGDSIRKIFLYPLLTTRKTLQGEFRV